MGVLIWTWNRVVGKDTLASAVSTGGSLMRMTGTAKLKNTKTAYANEAD